MKTNVISFPNALSNPWTMMTISTDAYLAESAMNSTWLSVNLTKCAYPSETRNNIFYLRIKGTNK